MLLRLAFLSLLASATVAVSPCPPDHEMKIIDFEAYEHGEIVQDLGDGITVLTTGGLGRNAMIYDTGITGGQDPDLEVYIGKCLIIPEDDAGAIQPNDNNNGGFMRFRFGGNPVYADQITILDAEATGTLRMLDVNDVILSTVPIPAILDGESEVVQMDTADTDVISVQLVESGAVCELQVCVPRCPHGSIKKKIDFEDFVHGQLVDDLGDGITVRTTGGLGNYPVVYDTDLSGGADPDLEVGVGKCLVIQEDNTGASVPDDNDNGGFMRFRFNDQPVYADRMTLLDIEVEGTLRLQKDNVQISSGPISPTGDATDGVLDIVTDDVDFLSIQLQESGAVCDLEVCVTFCEPGQELVKFAFGADINGALSHGDYVGDFGFFTVSTSGGFGTQARIYDSGITGGADDDLEVNKGNLIIIQQDDGEVNDNVSGGRVVFEFAEETKVKSMGLVDYEVFTQVQTFDATGAKRQSKVPAMDNEEFLQYELPEILNETGVKTLRLRTKGSGGIANLELCVPAVYL